MRKALKVFAIIAIAVLSFLAGMQVQYWHTQYGWPQETISRIGGG